MQGRKKINERGIMFIAIAIIAAALIVVYLYFLLNKAVEEPKSKKELKKEDRHGSTD